MQVQPRALFLFATLSLGSPAFSQTDSAATPDAGTPPAADVSGAAPAAPEAGEASEIPGDAAPSDAPEATPAPSAPFAPVPGTSGEAGTQTVPPSPPETGNDQEPAAPEPPVMETVIVGTPEARTSGSGHTIKEEKLERFEYDDPQRILQSVPGVYARTEDAVGLRPNIGLRGANSDRSKKVTLLEDGVLFGPAPYSAPAAYYFPLMTRMRSVRILKGPSAIIHGPQTIGGSVELLTRSVPYDEALGLDLAGGSFDYGKAHAYYGASSGRSGFLIEGVHVRSNGFKELDGGGNTGFRRNEWMFKGRRKLELAGPSRQSIELKLGYSDEVSNETYLGLTDADFAENPLRRYSASRFDRMSWVRTQVALSHELDVGRFSLVTTAYRHDFDRIWRKVNHFRGAGIADVLARPEDARNQVFYDVLTGAADSSTRAETLFIGPNQRNFVSQGIQSRARAEFETGAFAHTLEFGARYHYDLADRVHTQDGFLVRGGALVPEGGLTETTLDNRDSTHAIALHAIDAISYGRFLLTPGARLELIRSRSRDRILGTDERGRVAAVLPGLGLYTALTQSLGVFGGAYRGFSPPAPGQGDEVAPENSWNFEAGARWSRRRERVEVVGFHNAYSNLTTICTESNGCADADINQQYDAGEARIQGIEAFAEKSFRGIGSAEFPFSVAYTFTRTELLQSFRSADPQLGVVQAGDELPYVPRHQLVASGGIQTPRVGLHAQLNFIGTMRETAGQGETPAGERTDELMTVDVTANANLWQNLSLYANARNVFNELVIVSRRPFGARPNAPRLFQVGLKYNY